MKTIHPKEAQKEFLSAFDQLMYRRSSWEVWSDFVTMFAQSISNAVDKRQADRREAEYLKIISKYTQQEQSLFPVLCAATVTALDANPEQDFLGELYMSLNLGNHWKGQFFTPYSLCQAMSEITIGDAEKKAEDHGWTSVCDPACGAGATLIAAANTIRRHQLNHESDVNYQESVLFVGQDIDHVAAMMCYIQLSLLGCPGYICVGNTLTNPMTGHPLFPVQREGQEFWFTPMFFSQTWNFRRLFHFLDHANPYENAPVGAATPNEGGGTY